jgi:iron(III) transport system permease protein
VALASVGKGWSLTPFPLSTRCSTTSASIVETPKYILNSFLYSGLAVLGCVDVRRADRLVLARTRAPGRDLLDGLNTLILAIPGTAIGIAYVRAFHAPFPASTSS